MLVCQALYGLSIVCIILINWYVLFIEKLAVDIGLPLPAPPYTHFIPKNVSLKVSHQMPHLGMDWLAGPLRREK